MENKIVLNTHKELERLLETEYYNVRAYRKFNNSDTKKIEDKLERLNSGYLPPEGYTLFDDMEEELGRIPTQEEFLSRHVSMIKEHTYKRAREKGAPEGIHMFDRNGYVQFSWNDVIDNYYRYRANNLYMSMMAELSALLHIRDLYPSSVIYTGGILDTLFKVDLAVQFPEEDLNLYFHVTGYTEKYQFYSRRENKTIHGGSRASVRNKATRYTGGYPIGMHKDFAGNVNGLDGVKYRQNSPSHIILAYQKLASRYDDTHQNLKEGTMDINGNRLFTRDYLEELIDASLRGENLDGTSEWDLRLSSIKNTPEHNLEYMLQHENLEKNELKYFIEWAQEKGQDLSGIKTFSSQLNRVYQS